MKSMSRRLIGAPVLLQDWDTDAEEISAKYWELFLDLLLVGAASTISNNFRKNLTWFGLFEFFVLYMVVVNGWMLYWHVTTRFEDGTLYHSIVLFPYLLGVAICTVNASFQTAESFALGAALMRVVMLVLFTGIYITLKRARPFCRYFGTFTLLSLILFVTATFVPTTVAIILLTITTISENSIELVGSFVLKNKTLIPINIEHTKDRLGCLVLVMLGETVVSAIITYNAISTETIASKSRYYWILGLSFLLIFMFTLLFFHLQPPPPDHCLRRNRILGSLFLLHHKLLGMALLAVGVSVKLMVKAVVDDTKMTATGALLTWCSVGSSLVVLFGTRLLHYGGVLPRKGDPPRVQLLMWIWWVIFGTYAVIPFAFLASDIRDPVTLAGLNSGLIFSLCVIESSFSHILTNYLLPRPHWKEAKSILEQTKENYQSMTYLDAEEGSAELHHDHLERRGHLT